MSVREFAGEENRPLERWIDSSQDGQLQMLKPALVAQLSTFNGYPRLSAPFAVHGATEDSKAKDVRRESDQGDKWAFGNLTDSKKLMGSLRTIRLLAVEDDPAYLYLIRKAFSGRAEQTRWDLTTGVDGQVAVHILFEE